MPSLHETQGLIAAALGQGDSASVVTLLRGAGDVAAARRLHVYRNNHVAALATALTDVYPVTTRLVGEDFFRQLARAYIARHPSTSGDLQAFGAMLPAFIRRQASLATLPYLADVAALEWAVHEVYHEADEQALDVAALARVEAAAQLRIRLHLQLATHFVASPFPVLTATESTTPDRVLESRAWGSTAEPRRARCDVGRPARHLPPACEKNRY